MHIVYGMIGTLRKENAEIKEEMRQRHCSREKEMRLSVENISDITSALVDRKLQENLHLTKNVSTDTDHSTLLDQEVTVMKENANEKLSWDKKVKIVKKKGAKL